MSASETESADADTDDESTDEESFTYFPQVTQHPTTIIEGEVVRLVTGADLDSDKEDTGSSFGVVFEDPEVVGGTLWQNNNIPEGYDSTAEFNDDLRVAIEGDDVDYIRGQEVDDDFIENARERVGEVIGARAASGDDDWSNVNYDTEKAEGTDFKVADPDDRDASIGYNSEGEESGIDVGGGEFGSSQVEDFGDADRIMVWYGGISGQRIGRILDANGLPFARFTEPEDEDDTPYLVKGLFQAPLGWRNTSGGKPDEEQFGVTKTREQLKDEETYPRVARPSVLRDDIDGRIFIGIGRFRGGNGFEPTVGRATDDYESVLATLSEDEVPWEKEYDTDILDMKYDQDVDEVLSAAFDNPAEIYSLYHGEGWQDEPEDAEVFGGTSDSGGSFDTPDVDVDDDAVDHPTEQEVKFAESVAENIAGTGVSPEDPIFPVTVTDEDGEESSENVDLSGLVEHNSGNFQVDPDVGSIREVVYENASHLSKDDL